MPYNVRTIIEVLQSGAPDFGTVQNAATITNLMALADGINADQADLIYSKERTVTSGANDDIDLNGALVGPLNLPVNFVKLVAMLIINKPRAEGVVNTTNLTIGGGTNPLTGYLGGTTPTIGPIRPGGLLLLTGPSLAGITTVTPGTGDILRIANSAGAAALYQIVLLGRSA